MHTSVPVNKSGVPLKVFNLLNCRKVFIMLFIYLFQSPTTKSEFTIVPQMSIVGAGATANFRCHHRTRNTNWFVNGTELVVGRNSPDIIPDIITDKDGVPINSLNIVGKLKYNKTIIQCRVSSSEVTPNVTLLVQGPLSEVSNITRILTTISWVAPFSLNLTNIEPDIVYCVDVYNITCGGRSHVISDCNVTEPRFSHTSLQPGYIYNITVTPRSNVDGASNGTSLTTEERFMSLNEPLTITLHHHENSNYQVMIKTDLKLNSTVNAVEPAAYLLTMYSVDGVTEPPQTLPTTSTSIGSSAIALNVNQPLSARRLWECRVFAFNCEQHPVTSFFELSTHEFQNISVASTVSGDIVVVGDFIAASEARGILVIIYSLSNDSVVHYTFAPRFTLNEQKSVTATVMAPSSDQYNVSVFVVEENGLPYNKIATRPRKVSVMREEPSANQDLVKFELHPNSQCITCTFLDSSTTDCVAVVHQQISQLSSSGLMNIESSHKFIRSGDTAYGCIEGVNLSDYQIGVFGLIQHMVVSSRGPGLSAGIIAGIVIGILVLIVVLTVAVVASVMFFKKYVFNQELSQNPMASSVLNQPSVKDLKDSDALYSVLEQNTQSKALDQPSAESVQLPSRYASVGADVSPGPLSRGMKPDDLHTVEYKEVEHQEESFTKGPGNADDVDRSGCNSSTDHNLALGFKDTGVNLFNSLLGPVVPLELTMLTKDVYSSDQT